MDERSAPRRVRALGHPCAASAVGQDLRVVGVGVDHFRQHLLRCLVPSGSPAVNVPAGRRHSIGVAARTDGGVAVPGGRTPSCGRHVGDGSGGEGVDGVVQHVDDQLLTSHVEDGVPTPVAFSRICSWVRRTTVNFAEATGPRSPACAMTELSTPRRAARPKCMAQLTGEGCLSTHAVAHTDARSPVGSPGCCGRWAPPRDGSSS